ncbi:MAG TPA: hypothetical protein ENN09_01200, partial [Planctomycetes bacterium]|nr:hypothetical protein [Planctomycetota bacterium]
MDADALAALASAALDESLSAGADLADVSVSAGSSRQVEVRDNRIVAVMAHQAREVVVRAVVGRRVGMYRLHSLAENDVRSGARSAVEVARGADPDPDFIDLPHPEEQPDAPCGLFDPAIASLDLARLRSWAADNVASAVDAVPAARISGVVAAFSSAGVLVNSNGVRVADEGTLLTLDFFAVMRKGDDAGSYFGFSEARELGGIAPDGIALRAARQAARFLAARDLPSGRYPLVLAPLASYDLFRRIAHAASAEEHQRKRSFFSGRVG